MAEIKAAWSLFENNTLTYYITGYISDYMFDDLVNEVNFYQPKNIRLVLFSPGGGILTAFAIYDYFKNSQTPIVADLYGICASAATVISCVADKVRIAPNAFYMIHYPFFPGGGEETEQETQTIEDITSRIVQIYSAKTGRDRQWLREKMDSGEEGELLTADQAVEFGFADEVITEVQTMAAHKQLFGFTQKHNNNKMEKNKFLDTVRALFGLDNSAKEDEVLNQIKEKLKVEVPDHSEEIQALNSTLETLNQKVEAIESKDPEENPLAEKIEALSTKIENVEVLSSRVEKLENPEVDEEALTVEALKTDVEGQIKAIKEDTSLADEIKALKKELAKVKAERSGADVPPGNLNIDTDDDKNKKVAKPDFMANYFTGKVVQQ